MIRHLAILFASVVLLSAPADSRMSPVMLGGAGASTGGGATCTAYDSAYWQTSSGDNRFGYSTTEYQTGQWNYSPANSKTVCQIDVKLTATGTISDRNYYLKITLISGTSLSTVQGTSDAVLGSDAWSDTTVAFSFSTPVAISNGTAYAIVIYTDGAVSTSNYASLRRFTDGVQTDGQYYRLWNSSGASMDQNLSYDIVFRIYTND